MKKFQLIFHHFFRFIWNVIFVISYPIMATFGLILIGLTFIFSWISRLLAGLRSEKADVEIFESEWKPLNQTNNLFETKIHKQIIFGPTCFELRRTDGIPSVLQDYYFGSKVRFIEEGVLLERWNSTDSKELPDFDICLYDPDSDKLTPLTNIKCFDWHLSEKNGNNLLFKWFDGFQGGEVNVAI